MPSIELTAESIKSLVPPAKGKCDWYDKAIKGFIVEVRSTGSMTYALRYRTGKHGTQRQYTIATVGEITCEKARSVAEKMRARVVLGEDPVGERKTIRKTPTLKEYSVEYVKFAKGYKRSWESDDSLLRIHILPKLGHYHVDEIRTEMIVDFHHGMRAAGYAAGTANRALVLLKYMYSLMKKRGIPGGENSPAAEAKLFEVNNHRERYLTQEEAQRLYQAVKASRQPMLQYIVSMLILSGARRREVLDAQWTDFDLARRTWRIPMTKSGKPRHVPLSEGALQVLASVPRFDNCSWVFPNPKTRKPMVSGFSGWDNARRKAGLADVRMHDLRHSFASFLVNAGRSLYEVQKLLGHSQIKTTQRYSHLAPETLLAATDAVTHAAGLKLGGPRVVATLPESANALPVHVELATHPVIESQVIEVEKLAA